MTRYHVFHDASTGEEYQIAFSPDEEAATDDAEAARTSPSEHDLLDVQLRLALVQNGYSLEAIETTIKSIEDPVQRELAWTYWDRCTVIKWDHPQTQAFIAMLGIPVEYAKDMWMAAAASTF